jgi:DNA repair photolyase
LKPTVDVQREILVNEYEAAVGKEGARKARRDQHSRRRPIQCGLTIHPGSDCAYSCIYCYILDMGFKFQKPKPSQLKPEELALALLYNPYFVPGRNGTYIAIGSVIEPFQPELKSLTLSYIAELAKFGNPIQFSSKSNMTSHDAKAISSSCNWISPLVTILTLDESKARLLEPSAPSPRERLDAIANLADAGLRPFVFLRPVLPGIVTVDENISVIDEAMRCGSFGVVVGNLRVTRRIVDALKRKGFNVSDIERRTKVIDEKQRVVPAQDFRDRIKRLMDDKATVYMRSCCASASCAGLRRCVHENVGSANKHKALKADAP